MVANALEGFAYIENYLNSVHQCIYMTFSKRQLDKHIRIPKYYITSVSFKICLSS